MTDNKQIINEDHFCGAIDIWLNQFPEYTMDNVMKLIFMGKNINSDEYKGIKEKLWIELSCTVYSWGNKSPTELGITPSELKKYAKDIKKKISKAENALNALTYNEIFSIGTNSKEFIVANKIRQKSKHDNLEASRNVSSLLIKQEYEDNKDWGKYCPLDYGLNNTIDSLRRIVSYIELVIEELDKSMKGRGKNKEGKDSSDSLIFQLCKIYKKYTGEEPFSWRIGFDSQGDIKPVGKILLFLQIIIPSTYYPGVITAEALNKKIFRIKNNPKYKFLWGCQ